MEFHKLAALIVVFYNSFLAKTMRAQEIKGPLQENSSSCMFIYSLIYTFLYNICLCDNDESGPDSKSPTLMIHDS